MGRGQGQTTENVPSRLLVYGNGSRINVIVLKTTAATLFEGKNQLEKLELPYFLGRKQPRAQNPLPEQWGTFFYAFLTRKFLLYVPRQHG